MQNLKLMALDAEDLSVLSAQLQDAVLRVEDLTYLAGEQRFAMVLNRFDWSGAPQTSDGQFSRIRSGLRFERVARAQLSGIDLNDKSRVLSLLAVTFEAGEEPSGTIDLVFSGDASLRLHVECIEAELRDLGAQWATKKKPDHSIGD
ncbi:MAG: DUF2948 family protein [Alphaproteobacteria bacterium]|nr:DUF2948 family protein [Alphaproteobacteria bacterium]